MADVLDDKKKFEAIQELMDMPTSDINENMDLGLKATRHIIAYAKMQIGCHAEMFGVGSEREGSFDVDSDFLDEEELKDYLSEWRQVLMSCRVLEGLVVGEYVEAFEYPKLIKEAEARVLTVKQ